MNLYAWVLLAALAALAAGEVWSVARGRVAVLRVTGPATGVLLLALAWLLHADAVGYGRWLLLGLLAALLRDALSLDPSPGRRLAGLGAGAFSHLGFVAAILTMPAHPARWVGVLGAGALGAFGVARVLRWAPARPRPQRRAAAAYLVLLGATSAAGWFAGGLVVALGASLVAAADAVRALAWWRATAPEVAGYPPGARPPGPGTASWGSLGTHSWEGPAVRLTSSIGQVLLLLGILRGLG